MQITMPFLRLAIFFSKVRVSGQWPIIDDQVHCNNLTLRLELSELFLSSFFPDSPEDPENHEDHEDPSTP
jgi:hypothetical protein